jgi:hypothetical protein
VAEDWGRFRAQSAALLERSTGQDVAAWTARIAAAGPMDEPALRAWLKANGVAGYAAQLLRWETLGYPDFMTASADQLVEAQYADRPQLRPVYDAVLAAALALGDVTVQARKTYVSLVGPRRTFARVQAATKSRVDVALRLDAAPTGRLRKTNVHDAMPVGLGLERPEDLDDEALDWLRKAYDQNT